MKQKIHYIIVALWASAGSAVGTTLERWGKASTTMEVIMVLLDILLMAVSLYLIHRYKPESILNPYLAGPKTKALFMRKPLLAGFVTMVFFVTIMAMIMMLIN